MLPREVQKLRVALLLLLLCANYELYVTADQEYSCYRCNGDDCVDPSIQQCSGSGQIEQEKCFIHFDEERSVTQMGCLSELGSSESIIEMIKTKLLFLCELPNCNFFTNIPVPIDCTQCNSYGQEECATEPKSISATAKCTAVPYTHCFQRVNPYTNETERGCVTDLDGDDFYECVAGDSGKCQVCLSKECNRDIVPTDRPRCHRCSSKDDPQCEARPDALSPCPLYSEDEACVSLYANDTTWRGCLSEQLKCIEGSRNCDICRGNGCNTVNIRQRQDEIYGIFDELPLTCNFCNGTSECASNFPLPGQECTGSIYQDCWTVFDSTGRVAMRGCEAEVLATYADWCESKPEFCFNCKASGCNTARYATFYQNCLYCESSNNRDCLFHPEAISATRRCQEGCVASLYTSKIDPPVQHLARMCFEDIPTRDWNTCLPENNCVGCFDTYNCNTDILPTDGRLSCLHCSDREACAEGGLAQSCLGYVPDDQCFTYVDYISGNVSRRGCRSDLKRAELDIMAKFFRFCNGNDCNDRLPSPLSCALCNSAFDPNCAIDPSAPAVATVCDNLPNTECYTRVMSNGHTDRGCLQDLVVADFLTCQSGNASCSICDENNCNTLLFPANRRQCYHCNSAADPECALSPQSTQYCLLYRDNERCITKLLDDVTYRGCESQWQCEPSENSSTCQTCAGDNCNDVILVEDPDIGDIGAPGKFQPLPLNCLHCEGESDCNGSALGVVRPCLGNELQVCSTVFSAAGVVIGRGCSDSTKPLCLRNDTTCYGCKSNACNTVTSTGEYIDCLFCDSVDNESCIFDVSTQTLSRKCRSACMTSLYQRKFGSTWPSYELTRTCLDDMDVAEQQACLAGDDPNCIACTTSLCNTDHVGVRELRCLRCAAGDCAKPSSAVCRAIQPEGDRCAIEFDAIGDVISLGCRSDYDWEEVTNLTQSKQLYLCDGNNCNNPLELPEPQECVICSSRTNANCATEPSRVSAKVTCDRTPYTHCYTRILSDGHTERGCVANLYDEEFLQCVTFPNATGCQACLGNGCNQEVFPAERRSCHVCYSCDALPRAEQVCLLYAEDEVCVTRLEGDDAQVTVRGCGRYQSCAPGESSTRCQSCSENNCNAQNLKRLADGRPGLWQPLPLTCLNCTSREDCEGNIMIGECSDAEYCVTVFDTDGTVVGRGCSNAIEAAYSTHCDTYAGLCHNCNSNECNTATSLDDYVECIYCDAEHPNCARQPELVSRRRLCHRNCMSTFYARPNSSSVELLRTCLDDKEEADQQTCLEGDSLCKACNGTAACNSDLLVTEPLSCYQCVGIECEDPVPSPCPKASPFDQCYYLFDNSSNLVQLGCLSNHDDEFLESNRNRLSLCSQNNCNSFENIPTPKVCVRCLSWTEPDCASAPQEVGSLTTCTTLPNNLCFTRVQRDGSTERGCLSGMLDVQQTACREGRDCTTCQGDRCNIEIFPADRRRCHRCNSEQDPNCEDMPNSSEVCPFYSENQFCSTKLVDGHTYRGCSADFQCDEADKQSCRMCRNFNNCNAVNLAAASIGWPGRWQPKPISCFHCHGDDCANNMLGVIRPCSGNPDQNCAIVFTSDGGVAHRSCSDQVYNTAMLDYCDRQPELCKFCKSNGCNVATSLDDYVDCIFCDADPSSSMGNAATAEGCLLNATAIARRRSCRGGCVSALYPRNDLPDPAFELARTCLDDLEYDGREECLAGSDPHCAPCSGPACNTAAVPPKRLSCLSCVGDSACQFASSRTCASYRQYDQCYTLFGDRGRVGHQGCASEWDSPDLAGNKRRMLFCDGDDCNTRDTFPSPQACFICNSASDPRCANAGPAVIGAFCDDLPYTQCYTRIDANGVTRRGCISDTTDEVFESCLNGTASERCSVCTSDFCNNLLYPPGRRSCLRCDSNSDPECLRGSANLGAVCPIFVENDSCVTEVRGDTLYRGCRSELTCDPADTAACRICDSEDNCNTVNLLASSVGEPGRWQDLPLSCWTCSGVDCSESASTSLQVCANNNLQNCVTRFDAQGRVLERGCSDAINVPACDLNPERCIACKSNACNNATSIEEFGACHFCDSASSGVNCSVAFSGVGGRTRPCRGACMVALYPRTSHPDTAYELVRSCLDDMEREQQELCLAGDMPLCEACVGERCNSMPLPAERLSCYRCSPGSAGCAEANVEAQLCPLYQPEDQCFMLFDEQRSVMQLGCRSDLEPLVLAELLKQQLLRLCDGDNCNGFETIPAPRRCSFCDSALDPNCATNPNLNGLTTLCATIPYPECAIWINGRGDTERGCLASLSGDAFYDCLTGANPLCHTCLGDNCNALDVFPADRQRCHQCSSDEDPACTSAPQALAVCPRYSGDDKCLTNWRNGITMRGCRSSMRCDNDEDPLTCRQCSPSGCNTIDLDAQRIEGRPGRWQSVPIGCMTCDTAEDCSASNGWGVARVCTGNRYQNCLTVFDEAGVVVRRGCSDQVRAQRLDICASNPERCFACNSNGCNVATRLEDYIDCWACDTDESGACVNDVATLTRKRRCHRRCMTALYERESDVASNDTEPAYSLTRSCWDDMEYDEREECALGRKEFCVACEQANCNAIAIPEQRLSCYHCDSEESCSRPLAQACPFYRALDLCYILFDEQQRIASMGCRSAYSNPEADRLLAEKRLFLCENDNCNTRDALPEPQECMLCSSRTNTNCAIDPSAVLTATTCAQLPHTDCYTRVLPNGATERGCLSNLVDEEFVGCLQGTSATCQRCSNGDKCNNAIFPADRFRCHTCNSADDPSCETAPNSLALCPKYDPAERCVSTLAGSITYRGCASSLSCSNEANGLCEFCNTPGCNTLNLVRRKDDNYGKWQDLPLTCWTCSGDHCVEGFIPLPERCENNNLQDCMIVFDADGQVLRRGCEDSVEREYGAWCDAHPDRCPKCKSNNCNTAASMDEFVDCLYCDSHTNVACVQNATSIERTRRCQGGCMAALYPNDASATPAYDLIRTCLSDKEADDRTKCSLDSAQPCQACADDNCNTMSVPPARRRCHTCQGEGCIEPQSLLCPLYKPDDGCFAWYDEEGSITQMGCSSELLRSLDLATLVRSRRVFLCNSGDNCNAFELLPLPTRCAICDSGSEPSCATDPTQVATYKTCRQLPYPHCHSSAVGVRTVRGCVADLSDDDFVSCVLGESGKCTPCLGDGCNRDIFPADRLQCFHCDSDEQPSCELLPEHLRPCATLDAAETCITALSGNRTMRGCASNLYCDANDRSTCRSCSATACNAIALRGKRDDGYHGYWQALPLRCHTCAGEECANSLGPALECRVNAQQDCMSVFELDGSTVRRRGCSDDVEDYEDLHCRLNPRFCHVCKSNECNDAWSLDQLTTCFYCNSAIEPSCSIAPHTGELAERTCQSECMVALLNGTTIRSCLDDKELRERHECRIGADGKVCSSCQGAQCNDFIFPRDRLSCHECSGDNCATSMPHYCERYDEHDTCIARYENRRVTLLGCASTFNGSDIELWESQNELYRCTGADCNALSLLPAEGTCLSCDSSKTLACAQEPSSVSTRATCDPLNNHCITRITREGRTVRDCASSISLDEQLGCLNNKTCSICNAASCNNQIYPANRRRCHICNSTADESCRKEPNALKVCPIYEENDRCVSTYSELYLERGCTSEIRCKDSYEACEVCDLNDGCNTADLWNSANSLMANTLLLITLLAMLTTFGLPQII